MLKVLLTNHALVRRGGTELYIRDVARELLRRGHRPMVYSPTLGEAAEELRMLTVPVTNRLSEIKEVPDVIHGHHHVTLWGALTRFPRVPAIHISHGWIPWQEKAYRHPRILRHFAVSEAVRDRMVGEWGFTSPEVGLLYNFADLERFLPRTRAIPQRPERALVMSTYPTGDPVFDLIQQACRHLGIHLDIVGAGNAGSSAPEGLFPQYDLVFAKARTAIEALCSGCGVVVADYLGIGELVTTKNFEGNRRENFGIRTLRLHCRTTKDLISEIEKFDPTDVAKVSSEMRTQGSLTVAGDVLERIYGEVAAAGRDLRIDHEAEMQATSAMLSDLSRLIFDHAELVKTAELRVLSTHRSQIVPSTPTWLERVQQWFLR